MARKTIKNKNRKKGGADIGAVALGSSAAVIAVAVPLLIWFGYDLVKGSSPAPPSSIAAGEKAARNWGFNVYRNINYNKPTRKPTLRNYAAAKREAKRERGPSINSNRESPVWEATNKNLADMYGDPRYNRNNLQ